MSNLSKPEKSWILYDVANSAFTMLISTTIPIFFRSLAEQQVSEATASGIWGLATSAAVLILAVLSPFLGALADYRGMKKRMFSVFLVLGIAGLLILSFTGSWISYMLVFVLTRLCYSACNIFYDSMLVDVTSDERMDRADGPRLLLRLRAGLHRQLHPLCHRHPADFGAPVRPLHPDRHPDFLCHHRPVVGRADCTAAQKCTADPLPGTEGKPGQARLFPRGADAEKNPSEAGHLLFYPLAYFCYIDGVYTIISMATTYGGEVGISDTSMILALLLTQFVAFPCAIFAGRLAEKIGTLKVIRISILIYCGICIFGYQLDQSWEFWVLAVIVGMAQGGIQSLSRSFYGRIIPKEESNEYFGFFDIFGKFADFFGPLIMSFCALALGSSTYGILALLVLFIIGYVLLRKVPEVK